MLVSVLNILDAIVLDPIYAINLFYVSLITTKVRAALNEQEATKIL